ncbi:CD209 antigen-like protein B [Enoplosus armatus]|uniref:CD209 antigen-like protein B n=1 Tax=Enoplosus armatus TaxID=215367 RepID=UPI003995ACF8
MVGHQWLPWMNNPAAGSISVTSAKQEQELSSDCLSTRKKGTCLHLCPVVGLSALCLLLLVICVALSVLYNNESESKPEWKGLLFDYQNISDSYLTLTKANSVLKGDNDVLKEHSAWLHEQTERLNRTSADLMSVNLALSLESSELMEQIVNLTSTNLQLTQEHERLVQLTSEQQEKQLNTSRTIKYLLDSNTQREEEERRLSETNSLLRDELLHVGEKNRELLEINDKFQAEMKNLSETIEALLNDDREKTSKRNMQLQQRVTELQEQNQNLSTVLMNKRQEAAEREESCRDEVERAAADMRSMKEAHRSLDLYCPEVNHKTRERICKKCPDSWRLFDTKCYYFSSRMLAWSSSRAWCRTQGGDLLIINSEPEQSFVFGSSQALEQSGSRLWIGLTDAEEEGEWLWVDGSSVTSDVQYWLSRPGMGTEPDDWKQDDPLGEDCGHIDTSEKALKSWMDGSCKIPYRWICEKNV